MNEIGIDLTERDGLRLAVEGCGHGTLHAIYASVKEACGRKGWPGVDMLIIGGDFQSVRNCYDLKCVSMPDKYRKMGDFHEYYSGNRQAPYLTVFVGGNHEASNYLFELYYGGWVAPNIYYLGAANVLQLGPLRIAGLSGIWKGLDYRKTHFERLPYQGSEMKSIYHVRELDVRKLLQVRTQVGIGISHDWPRGIEWKGNYKQLFRFKRHFEEDAKNGQLGSVAAEQVLNRLRPPYWFSAHLHCKYAAVVRHGEATTGQSSMAATTQTDLGEKNGDFVPANETSVGDGNADMKNDDEIDLDLDEEEEANVVPIFGKQVHNGTIDHSLPANSDEIDLELEDDVDGVAPVAGGQGFDGVKVPTSDNATVRGPILSPEDARAALPASFSRPSKPRAEPIEHPPEITNTKTNFLALDKCLPNRHFLQLTSVPVDLALKRPLKLEYDREWLAITRAFALHEPLVLGDPTSPNSPAKSQAEYRSLIEEQLTWIDGNLSDSDMVIPENFQIIAPVYDGGNWDSPQYRPIKEHPNPQTARYCEMLQIPNAFQTGANSRAARPPAGSDPDPELEREGYQGRRGGPSNRGPGRFRGGRGRGRGWR